MYFGGRINKTCLEDGREGRCKDCSEVFGLEDQMEFNQEGLKYVEGVEGEMSSVQTC